MLDTVLEPSYLDLQGTVRAVPPEKTYARIKPFFKEFGITRVADVTGLDNIGIPVMLSVRPNAKSLSVAQGKGATADLARVSAVMESIEHFHAEQKPECFIKASYNELKDKYDIPPLSALSNLLFVHEHLESRPLEWTLAKNLVTQQPALLPIATLHLDSTQANCYSILLNASTNGLASGNTLDEATCHALYEAIERDGTYHWNTLSTIEQDKTEIDLATIDTPFLRELINKLHEADVQIKLYNLTRDNGIPTFSCLISDNRPHRRLTVFGGHGTHANKAIALSRALTEAVQSRITSISGSRDDMSPEFYGDWKELNESSTLERIDYMQITSHKLTGSFVTDKEYLCQYLRDRGFKDIYLFDYTMEKYQIPVVRVLVPQLKFLSE